MRGVTIATLTDVRHVRVDHTGGFRKPERLLDVYRRYARGEATDPEVQRVQAECVRELIGMEEAHNLPVLSNSTESPLGKDVLLSDSASVRYLSSPTLLRSISSQSIA